MGNGMHWYDENARIVHEVPDATGKRLVQPTVVHARKLGLLPSVTTILKTIAKPGLEKWLQGKFIISARTAPWPDGMSEEDFIDSITSEAYRESAEAADLGARCHDAIRDYLLTKAVAPEDVRALVIPVISWINQNIESFIHIEYAFANPRLGYAGQVDCVAILKDGSMAVIDWKTQGKVVKEIRFHDDWPWQLAAYSMGLELKNAKIFSVAVSTKEPGISVREYENVNDHFDIFLAAQKIWCALKNYDPRRK